MDVDGRIINILQEADVAIIVCKPWDIPVLTQS